MDRTETELTFVPRLWVGQEPPANAVRALVIKYRDGDAERMLCGWEVPVTEDTFGLV